MIAIRTGTPACFARFGGLLPSALLAGFMTGCRRQNLAPSRLSAIVLLLAVAGPSLAATSDPPVYRAPLFGPYGQPPGPTNLGACLALGKLWYATKDEACQATKAMQMVCDRSNAIYALHVATLNGNNCNLQWKYKNIVFPPPPPPEIWNTWSTSGTVQTCGLGFIPRVETGECVPLIEIDLTRDRAPSCGYGNPIYPQSGIKRERVETGLSIGKLRIDAIYDNLSFLPSASPWSGQAAQIFHKSFSAGWSSSLHRRLIVHPTGKSAHAWRGNGTWLTFRREASGAFAAEGIQNAQLVRRSDGSYRLTEAASHSIETYASDGRLTRIDNAEGVSLTLNYSSAAGPSAPGAGYLIGVSDSFGRIVGFNYDATGAISKMTDPSGRWISASYQGGNLVGLTWQDLRTRTFIYDKPGFASLLTGIIDENSVRVSTFGYDSSGSAISTTKADGVDRYSVTYGSLPLIIITDTFSSVENVVYRRRFWQPPSAVQIAGPTSSSSAMSVELIANQLSVVSLSQPAGSGCAASASAQGYDANGNLASRDDFNGYRTCYANDLSRNLETTRVEGLPGGASCTVTAAGSTLPAGSRKISTEWHPDWKLPIKQSEPGRITTSVYNGQPDPFAGGATASCAPASATLPDGKRIAVLCRQVEQATTDADGAQGLTAALEPGVAAREQRWTYNQFGQVLTHDGPLPGTPDTTVYSYYTDTVFTGADPNAVGHTTGDLRSVTNPAGHVTHYTLYNKTGQVLQSIDPNGVTTDYRYDPRQRLTTVTVDGQTSTYDYWPTGLLKKLTQPDGSYLAYGYDDAHRLTSVSDNLGNSIIYTLDNLGNRTAETVKDAGGNLRSQLSRGIDALGRVQQVTGRP